MATLLPLGDAFVPARLGFQVPLDGGSGNPQTYTVTSSNANIPATVAQGKFWTVGVTHTSSGAGDPSFSGTLTFQLFEDLTPLTTSRIETLTNQGFYTGKNFHRIASGFPGSNDYIVQGGSVNGNGTGEVGQPGFPFADEFVQQLAFTGEGQLAMANSGDDTNSSQFFATTGSPRFLDFQHTVFGQLVSGAPTLDLMTKVAKGSDGTTPTNPILITSASLTTANPDGVIHINTTGAVAGETSTITVTATDPLDNSTTTRTFQVGVTANTTSARPFLKNVPDQVVGVIQTTPVVQGQTAVFQLGAVNPNAPGTQLKYIVRGGKSGTSFTNVTNATATVDANGVVRVTPNSGFTGVINLLVGVGGPTASESVVDNWDTQAVTLTVVNGAQINLAPIATPGTSQAVLNTPSPIQLSGDTANPGSSQTLTYQIVTYPEHGTISQFDTAKGTFLYTPDPSFQGTDTVGFRVTDAGAPTPNLTSNTAIHTIQVGGGDTGSVRLIGRVLVVSPPSRADSVPNTVAVDRVSDKVTVTVNGLLDLIQPEIDDLDRIVVYGTKQSDFITVSPGIPLPATLDGGHGGTNRIQAGGGRTRGHVWFGRNTITGGPDTDQIIGMRKRFSVKRSDGQDLVFAGSPGRRTTLHARGTPPSGTLYRFVNGVLKSVPIPPAHPRSS